eukprot:3939441-Rhodomonas_salina.7
MERGLRKATHDLFQRRGGVLHERLPGCIGPHSRPQDRTPHMLRVFARRMFKGIAGLIAM